MKRSVGQWFGMTLAWVLVLSWTGCSKGPSDDEIDAALKARYYSDSTVKAEPIEISVKNGEVSLAGQVSSNAARLQAYKLASDTPGVKKVNDQMQLTSAASGAAIAAAGGEAKPKDAPPKDAAPKAAQATPPAPAPRKVTIPAGTSVRIQMIDSVNSKSSKIGDTFAASLAAPVVVGNEVVVPTGADVKVKLVSAKSAGKMKGSNELELELVEMRVQGKSYPLASSTYHEVGSSKGKQSAKRIGVGAGIGTAIGAIAGGGKGAAIGAGIGAGTGAAVQLMTHGKEVQVPSETKLDFQLSQPVSVTLAAAKKK